MALAALLLALGGVAAWDRALLRVARSPRAIEIRRSGEAQLRVRQWRDRRRPQPLRGIGVTRYWVALGCARPARRVAAGHRGHAARREAFRLLRLWALWGRLPGVASAATAGLSPAGPGAPNYLQMPLSVAHRHCGRGGPAAMSERDIDQQLVERAQRGDKQAFELLVEKYQRKLARLLSRLIRDPGEVEDVTQEAFVKAYRALPSFRGDSAFYTWLYRIGINTAKNYLVAMGRRAPTSTEVEAEEAEGFDERRAAARHQHAGEPAADEGDRGAR